MILLEDSAQALGSFYPDGVHQGRKGVAEVFIFCSKIISTGQGGIITDDDQVAHNISLKILEDLVEVMIFMK